MKNAVPANLFDQITGSGEVDAVAYLEGIVASGEKTFEDQFLEFKGSRATKIGDIWSRQLSAFANTGGGVVIWGIGTAKENGVECASTLDKVPNPLILQAELEKALQNATDPLVTGVVIKPIPSSGQPGFVVCYIPESTYKPHRAMLCTGHPYLGRFSHRTDSIPTAWLRQLFYPQKSLCLMAHLEVVASQSDETTWQINGHIRNVGPVTAQQMFVRIKANRLCRVVAPHTWKLLMSERRPRTFERGPDGFDYAKDRDTVAEIRTEYPLHPETDSWAFQCVNVTDLLETGTEIVVYVFSHDQSPLTATLRIDPLIRETIERETKKNTTVKLSMNATQMQTTA